MNRTQTRQELLDLAKSLLQRRGASGFSFQDLADRLKIRKASIHYHFKTKNLLLEELLKDYIQSFENWKEEKAKLSPWQQWESYSRIFRRLLKNEGLLCPQGALCVDSQSLPASLRKNLRDLHLQHKSWLTKLVKDGQRDGVFAKDLDPKATAILIGASLQGSLQLSRLHDHPAILEQCISQLERVLQKKKTR